MAKEKIHYVSVPIDEDSRISINVPDHALRKHITQAIEHLKVIEKTASVEKKRGKNKATKKIKAVLETKGIKEFVTEDVVDKFPQM